MKGGVLIAGVGNVFLGDDAFGVEVARRLQREALPSGVRVIDSGIRGLHLVYELLDDPELLVVVDAVGRGTEPGTVFVLEPEIDELPARADAHGMDLPAVFSTLVAMGGKVPPLRLVGCEARDVGEQMGLSPPVEAAVPIAMRLVREILSEHLGSDRGARS